MNTQEPQNDLTTLEEKLIEEVKELKQFLRHFSLATGQTIWTLSESIRVNKTAMLMFLNTSVTSENYNHILTDKELESVRSFVSAHRGKQLFPKSRKPTSGSSYISNVKDQ